MLYQLSYAPQFDPPIFIPAAVTPARTEGVGQYGNKVLRRGDVAQLVEHLLCKQGVRGSSPLISTRFSRLRLLTKSWLGHLCKERSAEHSRFKLLPAAELMATFSCR